MRFIALLAVPFLALGSLAVQAQSSFDYFARTRAIAFDPATFFPDEPKPWMSIAYSGDDYGYPVYSIAIRKGCTREDTGDARRSCGNRLVARMVRAPFPGTPDRPRNRGQRLFGALQAQNIPGDAALRTALARYGLEWMEANVGQCQPAMEMLGKSGEFRFFASPPLPADETAIPIVLHADKITFDYRGGYLTESRYYGWVAPGSPAEWADSFAQSLEGCWIPSAATAPWEHPPAG